MYEEDSEDARDYISDFLEKESFASLCSRILTVLRETDFLAVLKLIRKFLNLVSHLNMSMPTSWFEIILTSEIRDLIDELLLLNTVINHGRQLICYLQDEELREEKLEIHDVVLQQFGNCGGRNVLASIMRNRSRTNMFEMIKWTRLQSRAVHFRLSLEISNPEFWESLFPDNGISARKSNSYALLCQDKQFDGNIFGTDEIVIIGKVTTGRAVARRKGRSLIPMIALTVSYWIWGVKKLT